VGEDFSETKARKLRAAHEVTAEGRTQDGREGIRTERREMREIIIMAVIYIKPNKDVRVKEMKLKYEITNIN
jgi:hypothetical protein